MASNTIHYHLYQDDFSRSALSAVPRPQIHMSNYTRAPLVSLWFLKLKKTRIEFMTCPPQNYSSSNVFNLQKASTIHFY